MKIVLRCRQALAIALLAHAVVAFAHWPDQAPHQFADLGEFES